MKVVELSQLCDTFHQWYLLACASLDLNNEKFMVQSNMTQNLTKSTKQTQLSVPTNEAHIKIENSYSIFYQEPFEDYFS